MMKKQSRRGIERAVLVATVLTLGCGAIAACDGSGDDEAASGGDGGAPDGATGTSDGASPVGPDGALGVDSGPGEGLDGSTPGDDGGPTSHDGGGDEDDGGELADGGGDEDDGGPIPVVTCTRTFGDGVSRNLAYSIDVDGRGNIVFAGVMMGTVDFGGGPLTTAGGGDIFLVKLNNRCNHVFSKRFGDSAEQYSSDVRVGSDGSIYLVSNFNGAVDFGLGAVTNGGRVAAITKFSKEGTPLWTLPLKSTSWGVEVTALTIDSEDHLYFGGDRSPDEIAGHPITAAAGFFASVDSNGAFRWVKTASSTQLAPQVGVLSARVQGEEIWFAGRMLHDLDFGGGPINRPRWGWIYRLDHDGNAIDVHDFNGVDIQISRLGSRPYAFGSPQTTDVDLGTGPLNATDTDGGKISPDSFVALWRANGSGAIWAKTYGRRGSSPLNAEVDDFSQTDDVSVAAMDNALIRYDQDGGSSAFYSPTERNAHVAVAPTEQFVVAGNRGASPKERIRIAKIAKAGGN